MIVADRKFMARCNNFDASFIAFNYKLSCPSGRYKEHVDAHLSFLIRLHCVVFNHTDSFMFRYSRTTG